MNRWMLATVLGACGILAACGSRVHLGPNQGRQTHAFVEAQRIRPQAVQGTPTGLDSEEAALVHRAYRKSLGATTAAERSDSPARVLVLEEPGHEAAR